MSVRRAVLVVTLVCATRSTLASVPAECEPIVNSASDSPRVSSVTMRRCVDALRRPDAPAAYAASGSGEAAPAKPPVRQFAVLSELRRSGVQLGTASAARAASTAAEPSPATCALSSPNAASVPSARCLECHPRRGHPADFSYAAGYARASWTLRPEAEVVRRGVLLPQGRIECVTCHDGASPWKYKIALPPGAPALPAVTAGKPDTYGSGRSWRLVKAGEVPELPPGTQVTAAPLCAACHTHAD